MEEAGETARAGLSGLARLGGAGIVLGIISKSTEDTILTALGGQISDAIHAPFWGAP